jgi:hypothetical protein
VLCCDDIVSPFEQAVTRSCLPIVVTGRGSRKGERERKRTNFTFLSQFLNRLGLPDEVSWLTKRHILAAKSPQIEVFSCLVKIDFLVKQ